MNLTDIKGVGTVKARQLAENGFDSVEKVAWADPVDICKIKNFKESITAIIQRNARDLLTSEPSKSDSTWEAQLYDGLSVAEPMAEPEPAVESPKAKKKKKGKGKKDKKKKDGKIESDKKKKGDKNKPPKKKDKKSKKGKGAESQDQSVKKKDKNKKAKGDNPKKAKKSKKDTRKKKKKS